MKLATLCYVRKEGYTLMMHRVKKENDIHQGKWNGLGGKFNVGETPEECAIREVWEESGFIVENPQMKGFLTFPLFDGIDDWYVFVFLITKFTGELIESSSEGHLEWIANEKLLELNLWDGDRIFLPWLDAEKFFSGKFVYQDGQLIDHQVIFH